jgi:hypothetical protein
MRHHTVMTELIHESFRLINLPFTVALILVLGYWLLVALGALGGPAPDGDLEVNGDAHIDHDVDLDTMHHHVEGHHHGHQGDGGGWYGNVLKFVNLGEVPVMVILSVLILSMWALGIFANAYWTGNSSILKALFLAGNLAASAVITRYATMPLKPLFRILNKQYDEKVELIGQHCRVVSLQATPKSGQAEISTTGVPITINVRTLNDATLNKGDLAVIVREDPGSRIFFITANPLPNHH